MLIDSIVTPEEINILMIDGSIYNFTRHSISYDTSLTKEESYQPIKNSDGSITLGIENRFNNRIGYIKTTNVSLPNKFVLNFKINKDSSNDIGTTVLNIDGREKNSFNTGVFFTIAGKHPSMYDNTSLTIDGIEQQIIQSGLHTYNFKQPDVRILQGNDEFLYHANTLMKFNRDNTVDQLQEFLLKELDKPEGWYYKIIKNGNYLAVYTKKNLNDAWMFTNNYTFTSKGVYKGNGSKLFEARDTLFTNTLNGELRIDSFFSKTSITIYKFF